MNIDGYSNFVKIGEGGMAQVYRGIQDSLQRPVAIKLLINDLCLDEEARRRFERESYIIARLNHANIIHVIDRGINDADMPYFVMEFVEGTELNTATKMRQIPHQEKIDIIIQVLKALAYAHKNNVIHRDIKPDNILVDDDGNIKILDFGIAQFYEDRSKGHDVTSTGTIMGTYNYMSPEQRESSENVTIHSDLYSVGVVMYELFTGKLPVGCFPNPSSLNAAVEPQLDALILKCLNSDPGKRPASAEELKNQLLTISSGAHIAEEQRLRAAQGITQIKTKFLLLDILREDKFGAVYLYQQKSTGRLLIIKKKMNSSTGYEASNLLASLEHPNIVNTLGTSRNEDFFVLVQEYLCGGTLQDKLSFHLNWRETLELATQLCNAMIFAHNNRIVHGHLRPTNILFTEDGTLKVTDFSLKEDLSDVPNAHYYRLEQESPSKSADLYSVGVILYQLFTGCLPYRQNDSQFVIRKYFSKLPQDIQDLITNMLSTIPEKRDPMSLQKALAVFDSHAGARKTNAFTEKPHRDTKRTAKNAKDKTGAELIADAHLASKRRSASVPRRLGLLFGLLVVVYAQYLFLFDGQE
ncbi:MAG: protein kinase, partial [Gammaproteobacteria bacterium]